MKKLLIVLAAVVAVLVLIQLVPVNRTNPRVATHPTWDSPRTQELFTRACADCHSNETVWPWYSQVAPMSWLVARDVNNGRNEFNIHELELEEAEERGEIAEDIQEVISSGKMPLKIYLPLHPEARLTAAERQELSDGLTNTLTVTGER